MAWPHREPTVAELRKNFTDRAFVQPHPKAPLKLVAQIDPSPTHHAVTLRIGAGLDKRSQLGLLLHGQLRSRA